MWPAPPQKVQFAALALDPEGWAAACDRVSRPGMLRALLAVVQEGDDDSANLVCQQYSSMHTRAQGILSLPVWAAGHAQENASGRPGASDDKPRTCAHATQEQPEPALAKKNRSTEISRFRALPLSPSVCALHLRGTRQGKSALERRPDAKQTS